jgi:hypothetical protein
MATEVFIWLHRKYSFAVGIQITSHVITKVIQKKMEELFEICGPNDGVAAYSSLLGCYALKNGTWLHRMLFLVKKTGARTQSLTEGKVENAHVCVLKIKSICYCCFML